MSKERAAALEAIKTALKTDATEAPAEAICTLIGDGLNSLASIADSLKKLAEPPQMIQGEALKMDPLVDPARVERLTQAVEKLAGIHRA